ncbi:MAG: hypothetical protein AAB260_00390, partial [Planctomycetota bacterium]
FQQVAVSDLVEVSALIHLICQDYRADVLRRGVLQYAPTCLFELFQVLLCEPVQEVISGKVYYAGPFWEGFYLLPVAIGSRQQAVGSRQ